MKSGEYMQVLESPRYATVNAMVSMGVTPYSDEAYSGEQSFNPNTGRLSNHQNSIQNHHFQQKIAETDKAVDTGVSQNQYQLLMQRLSRKQDQANAVALKSLLHRENQKRRTMKTVENPQLIKVLPQLPQTKHNESKKYHKRHSNYNASSNRSNSQSSANDSIYDEAVINTSGKIVESDTLWRRKTRFEKALDAHTGRGHSRQFQSLIKTFNRCLLLKPMNKLANSGTKNLSTIQSQRRQQLFQQSTVNKHHQDSINSSSVDQNNGDIADHLDSLYQSKMSSVTKDVVSSAFGENLGGTETIGQTALKKLKPQQRIFQEGAMTNSEIQLLNDALAKSSTVTRTRPTKQRKSHFGGDQLFQSTANPNLSLHSRQRGTGIDSFQILTTKEAEAAKMQKMSSTNRGQNSFAIQSLQAYISDRKGSVQNNPSRHLVASTRAVVTQKVGKRPNQINMVIKAVRQEGIFLNAKKSKVSSRVPSSQKSESIQFDTLDLTGTQRKWEKAIQGLTPVTIKTDRKIKGSGPVSSYPSDIESPIGVKIGRHTDEQVPKSPESSDRPRISSKKYSIQLHKKANALRLPKSTVEAQGTQVTESKMEAEQSQKKSQQSVKSIVVDIKKQSAKIIMPSSITQSMDDGQVKKPIRKRVSKVNLKDYNGDNTCTSSQPPSPSRLLNATGDGSFNASAKQESIPIRLASIFNSEAIDITQAVETEQTSVFRESIDNNQQLNILTRQADGKPAKVNTAIFGEIKLRNAKKDQVFSQSQRRRQNISIEETDYGNEPRTAHQSTRRQKGIVEIKLDQNSFNAKRTSPDYIPKQSSIKTTELGAYPAQLQAKMSPLRRGEKRVSQATTGVRGMNLLEYYETKRNTIRVNQFDQVQSGSEVQQRNRIQSQGQTLDYASHNASQNSRRHMTSIQGKRQSIQEHKNSDSSIKKKFSCVSKQMQFSKRTNGKHLQPIKGKQQEKKNKAVLLLEYNPGKPRTGQKSVRPTAMDSQTVKGEFPVNELMSQTLTQTFRFPIPEEVAIKGRQITATPESVVTQVQQASSQRSDMDSQGLQTCQDSVLSARNANQQILFTTNNSEGRSDKREAALNIKEENTESAMRQINIPLVVDTSQYQDFRKENQKTLTPGVERSPNRSKIETQEQPMILNHLSQIETHLRADQSHNFTTKVKAAETAHVVQSFDETREVSTLMKTQKPNQKKKVSYITPQLELFSQTVGRNFHGNKNMITSDEVDLNQLMMAKSLGRQSIHANGSELKKQQTTLSAERPRGCPYIMSMPPQRFFGIEAQPKKLLIRQTLPQVDNQKQTNEIKQRSPSILAAKIKTDWGQDSIRSSSHNARVDFSNPTTSYQNGVIQSCNVDQTSNNNVYKDPILVSKGGKPYVSTPEQQRRQEITTLQQQIMAQEIRKPSTGAAGSNPRRVLLDKKRTQQVEAKQEMSALIVSDGLVIDTLGTGVQTKFDHDGLSTEMAQSGEGKSPIRDMINIGAEKGCLINTSYNSTENVLQDNNLATSNISEANQFLGNIQLQSEENLATKQFEADTAPIDKAMIDNGNIILQLSASEQINDNSIEHQTFN